MWRSCWLVALACCADPGIPPQFTLMQVNTIEGRLTVEGPTYRVAFSAVGVKLPEQLFINETDRLIPSGCSSDILLEGQIGASVFPAVTATAGLQGTERESTATVLIEGPAIVRVAVEYTIDYQCPAAEQLVGTSTFTMLPTGRIVRKDSISPSTNTIAPGATCGCEDSADLTFSTFYAFDPDNVQQVDETGAALADGVPKGCTIYPDAVIAASFNPGDGTPRSSEPGLHILDFARNVASLPNAERTTTSALQIFPVDQFEPAQCGDLLGLLDVVNLNVNGDDSWQTDLDGVYTNPVPTVFTGPITLAPVNFPIPAGFAIQLDLGGASHATISRPVDRVFRQRGPGSTFFFVFADGIDIGDSITIVPE